MKNTLPYNIVLPASMTVLAGFTILKDAEDWALDRTKKYPNIEYIMIGHNQEPLGWSCHNGKPMTRAGKHV